MNPIKVSELNDLALDWAVARELNMLNGEGRPRIRYTKNEMATMSLMVAHISALQDMGGTWYAAGKGKGYGITEAGSTPALAILRTVLRMFNGMWANGTVDVTPLLDATGRDSIPDSWIGK